jgi:hypothetical protein
VKKMAKKTPKVQGKQLYLSGEAQPLCQLDTPAWFAWLETITAFRYYTQRRQTVTQGYTRPMRPISVRKEKRRQGHLWYAYLRTHGQLYKRYVGKTAVLTQSKLDEVAAGLNEIW